VGVAPQYCGILGKRANGQVVGTTTYCDPAFAWPVNGQIYLPEAWIDDPGRRKQAHIPTSVTFQTKPELALALIDQARHDGVPFDLVVADGGYGDRAQRAPPFLDGLIQRQVHGVGGVHRDFGVRLPAEVAEAAARPLPTPRKAGRPRIQPQPAQVAPLHRADALIGAQPAAAWQTISWRWGSEGPWTKQFLAVRVQRAVGDSTGPVGGLVGERPVPGADGDEKIYWSDLGEETPLARLAELAHRRPSVERGYEEGKGQTGLGEYAARPWDSLRRHLVVEFLVLSWLVLLHPTPCLPPITADPVAVGSSEAPVFPRRTRSLPPCRHDPPRRLPVPLRGTPPLADSFGPTRSLPASWTTTPCHCPTQLSHSVN